MPQMSPMWWFSMMLLFSILFLLMNSLLYFNNMYMKTEKFNLNKKLFIWKW